MRVSNVAVFANHAVKNAKLYGIFRDQNDYLTTLDLLLDSTDETQNRIDFFLQNILPTVSKQKMIDVGVGDGRLTNLLASHFQEVIAVDTSIQALRTLELDCMNNNKTLTKIIGSILDVKLPANEVDLAVLSHILYYIDTARWIDIVNKLLITLKKDGLLVIVMNGGLDKDAIARTFSGRILPLEKFIQACDKLDVQAVRVERFPVHFTTNTLSSMMEIVGLHLYDVGAVARANELSYFLTAKKDKITQLYQFSVFQNFIIIKK